MGNPNSHFNTVLAATPPRSEFDLSSKTRTSFNMGQLVPTYWTEVLPGDSFRIRQENLIRFAPLIAPVMHDVKVKTYWFYVPWRLVYPNWENFISPDNADERNIVWPHAQFTNAAFDVNSLANYMDLPMASSITRQLSVLPFAAYFKIYDEWFRNAQIQETDQFVEVVDGLQTSYNGKATAPPLNSNYELDYFTSALPYAQKGDVITIPLLQTNQDPVVGLSGNYSQWLQRSAATGAIYGQTGSIDAQGSGIVQGGGPQAIMLDPVDTLGLLNFQTNAASITDLRNAYQLQSFQERDARGGTRYIEMIKNHWGVTSSDARLNRPEVIGMFSNYIAFSAVEQTSQTDAAGTAQGNLAGHGIGINGAGDMDIFCEEHGMIISMTTVKPGTSYSQGIHRKWERKTRLDYPWPSFQTIGEQEIRMSEINYDAADPDAPFGYVPRYSEVKFQNDTISGEFRTSLSQYHLSRIFDLALNPPVLNGTFLEVKAADSDRIFAVEGLWTHHLWCHFYHSVKVKRSLSYYGNPMM